LVAWLNRVPEGTELTLAAFFRENKAAGSLPPEMEAALQQVQMRSGLQAVKNRLQFFGVQ
jgi:hypothetical protein